MHDSYEEIAKEKNWETQKSTRVEFKDLPESNKQTMLSLVQKLYEHYHITKK